MQLLLRPEPRLRRSQTPAAPDSATPRTGRRPEDALSPSVHVALRPWAGRCSRNVARLSAAREPKPLPPAPGPGCQAAPSLRTSRSWGLITPRRCRVPRTRTGSWGPVGDSSAGPAREHTAGTRSWSATLTPGRQPCTAPRAAGRRSSRHAVPRPSRLAVPQSRELST